MIFDWYKIINQDEFLALDLVSKEVTLLLTGLGQKTILVTKGNLVSITYGDTTLSVGMNNSNPFIFNGLAVYLDANDDIWLGVAAS